MSLEAWLKGFRELHERAKRGGLDDREVAIYQAGRDELARALLAAQHVALQPGQKPRRSLRVARALQVDLAFADGNLRALTLELSAGGFSALVERPPRVEEMLEVTLRIPGGEPLRGRARVQQVRPQPGVSRVGFELVGVAAAELERLEVFVFDAVLARLQG